MRHDMPFRGEPLGSYPADADYLVTGVDARGRPISQSWNIGSTVIAELQAWKIRANRENVSALVSDIRNVKVMTFTNAELRKGSFLNYDWPSSVLLRS